MGRHLVALVVVVAAAVAAVVTMVMPAAVPSVWAADALGFVAVTPARLLDTRPGSPTVDGIGSGGGAVAAGQTITLHVTGRGGVPVSGVGAVALNVTVADASASSFVTVWGAGATRPGTSNVNPAAGSVIPNMVVTAVSASGDVSLFNFQGDVQLVVDVAGWFPAGDGFVPLTPARLVDTRAGQPTVDARQSGQGQLGPGGVLEVDVAGRAGLSAGGIGAVVLNVTADAATADTYVTAYPSGSARPTASALNPVPGRVTTNLVVSKVSGSGRVSLFNFAGSVDLIVDVVGWFPAGGPYHPVQPARLLDTRPGETTVDTASAGQGAIGAGRAISVHVAGRGGVASSGVGAVVLNVTAVEATEPTFVTVFTGGTDRPTASNLNVVPGRIAANAVFAKVSASGDLAIFNYAGNVQVVVDVVGWFPAAAATTPPPETTTTPTVPPTQAPDALAAGWEPSDSSAAVPNVPAAAENVLLPSPGTAAATAGVDWSRAGTLPVLVRLTDPGSTPVAVHVRLLSQPVADGAGASVVLAQLTADAPVAAGVQVDVAFDYSGFRHQFGGDWYDRLGVAGFDPCVLTAAVSPSCPGAIEEVPSENDFTTGRVSFTVDASTLSITPASTALGLRRVEATGVSASGNGGVFGMVSSVGGSAGTFESSAVAGSGSWSQGGSTGGFSWSYPLSMPSSPGGGAPGVSISYSSQALDGMTSETSSQATSVGLGWSLSTGGYIERRYVSCTQVGGTVQDNCWAGWNASLVLNGVSSELIPVDGGHDVWRLKDDNGWRIERLRGAPGGSLGDGTVAWDGEYWRVTTLDGTRFTFGYGREQDTDIATNSVWTVPVISARAGEPCRGAPNNMCQMGWRWNLDRVEDINGNVSTYAWSPELNMYGARGDRWHPVQYASGGELFAVGWSKRTGHLGDQPPARLDVRSSPRCRDLAGCREPAGKADGPDFPDVPVDLICRAAPCSQKSPGFFSTRKIDSITTSIWESGTYTPVDRYDLSYELPKGDALSDAKLWLRAIRRTGLRGGEMATPAVRFESLHSLLANRADPAPSKGVSAVNLFRVDTIRDELGGEISVTYKQPDDCATADWATNGSNCFPSWYAPKDGPAGWARWRKWLVTDVVQGSLGPASVHVGAQQYLGAATVTHFDYVGGAAWHYNDTPGVSKRSWSEFRGYELVRTTVGTGPTALVTETRYLRGMNGDRTAGGGTSTVTVATDGGTVDATPVSVLDEPWLQGRVLQTRALDGGVEVSSTITGYTVQREAVGTDSGQFTPDDYISRMVLANVSSVRRATGGNPYAFTTNTTTISNDDGLPVEVIEAGDGTNARCTHNEYQPVGETRDRVVHSTRFAGACGATVVSDTLLGYDSVGNPTTTRVSDGTGWITTSIGYGTDPYGRPVTSTDANGNTTTVAYVANPATGFPTDIRGTNALGQTVSIRTDPARGSNVSTTDARGNTTVYHYDPLGRLDWGQSPTETGAMHTVEYQYLFDLSNDPAAWRHEVAKIETRTLQSAAGDPGNTTGEDVYTYGYAYLDGLGRTIQSQTTDPTGGSRIVTNSGFDDRGLQTVAVVAYNAPGGAGDGYVAAPVTPARSTVTSFDGAGRTTQVVELVNGAAVATTTSAYTASSTTVTPPVGSPSTTIVDAYGRTVSTRTGANLPTTSTYDAADRLLSSTTGLTAARYRYDLAGRQVAKTDPDAGTWTYTYDANGNVVSSTDARGSVVTTTYDVLNRPVSRTAAGSQVAAWTYDQAGATGLLNSSTSIQPDGAYTSRVDGYDTRNRPTSTTVLLPNGMTSTTAATYDRAGHQLTTTMGAVGPAPAETVTTGYNLLGQPTTLTGATSYVASTSFDPRGRVTGRTLGGGVARQYTYDTRDRIESVTTAVSGAAAQRDVYSYDAGSNVTAIDSTVDGQKQCFQLDALNRLQRAYTTFTGATCDGTADTTAGPAGTGYDQSWTFSPSNDIDQRTDTDGTVHPYIYGTYHPHAPIDVGGESFGYDANGSRVGPSTDGPLRTSVYTPIQPVRIADTRDGTGGVAPGRLQPDQPRLVQIIGRGDVTVPVDATAVVVNVASIDPTAVGDIAVYAAGHPEPGDGQVTAASGGVVSNLVTVPLDATGQVALTAIGASSDAIVDVVGWYTPVSGPVAAGRFVPIGPTRVYDTRPTNTPLAADETRNIPLAGIIPADAVGVVAAFTATDVTEPSFFTVFPTGQYPPGVVPSTSTINVMAAGDSYTNQIQTITALGAGQTISVYSNKGGAVVVDVLGYITGTSSPTATDGELVILPTAQRVVDTMVDAQGSVTVQVSGHGGVPAGATGVVANMTSITDRRGWAQAVPGGTPASLVSQVNSNGGNIPVSAATVTALNAAGQVDLRSYDINRLQLDIIGYYTTTPPPPPATTGTSYAWDPQGRLATATTPAGTETYSYDTGGQRLAKHRPDGTTTYYVGTEITTDTTTVSVHRYYAIGSTTVATRKVTAGSSEVTWTGSDIQASQTIAVTNNGTTTRAYYTPYGTLRGGTTPTEHTFLNQVTDAGTGLNYLNARYQDPTNGIFTSVDPLNAKTGQPYMYGALRPTTISDPTGLTGTGWAGKSDCASTSSCVSEIAPGQAADTGGRGRGSQSPATSASPADLREAQDFADLCRVSYSTCQEKYSGLTAHPENWDPGYLRRLATIMASIELGLGRGDIMLVGDSILPGLGSLASQSVIVVGASAAGAFFSTYINLSDKTANLILDGAAFLLAITATVGYGSCAMTGVGCVVGAVASAALTTLDFMNYVDACILSDDHNCFGAPMVALALDIEFAGMTLGFSKAVNAIADSGKIAAASAESIVNFFQAGSNGLNLAIMLDSNMGGKRIDGTDIYTYEQGAIAVGP